MADEFEYDVFLSHASADRRAVRELAGRLKGEGLRVWLDEWVIQPGDSIPLAIEKGLESSRTLVLVMSQAAFDSEWVTLERHTVADAWRSWIDVADIHGREVDSETEATVILELGPVSFADTKAPEKSADRKWHIRFSNDEAFDKHRLQAAACFGFGRTLNLGEETKDPTSVMYFGDYFERNPERRRAIKPNRNDAENLRARL